jgi:hypothetical protein
MSLHSELDLLLADLTAGLRLLSGAAQLYLFGSLATPEADAYADIDLQLVTSDLALTQAGWPDVLEHIQPIELAWPITPDNTAFAVLFSGASYYHKVDIGLSARADGFAATLDPASSRRLWSQDPAPPTLAGPPRAVYRPAYGTAGHQLFDQLLGAVRYVKARKRGHQFTSWRFIRSRPEVLLHLLFEQHSGQARPGSSLTTWDYKKLDTLIDRSSQDAIMHHLDWSTPQHMDQNFFWFTEQIVQCYMQKAQTSGETVPLATVDKMLAFLQSELGLEVLMPPTSRAFGSGLASG